MSLVEVLVSMVIVSVVLIGLGQGLVLGIRMNVESKARIANLSVAKRVTENLKSQTQFSQALFDGASGDSAFNRTFYVDSDGNDIIEVPVTSPSTTSGSTVSDPTPGAPGNSSYQVTVAVQDWANAGGNTLSAVDSNGISHVMVKVLTVQVTTRQSAVLSNDVNKAVARQVTMTVEMVRPAV
jgi:type II secretory pathway pseudopilin PulG